MQALVYNQPKEYLVQTVSLRKNEVNPLITYRFHCPYCSNGMPQIQGIVDKLSPGLDPTETVVVINQCGECGMRYIFNQSQSSNDNTKITLTTYENRENTFSCYISRTRLLAFDQNNIWLLPSKIQMYLPFEVKCSAPNCEAHYRIMDLV